MGLKIAGNFKVMSAIEKPTASQKQARSYALWPSFRW
jgi:hypothetical protein